MCPNIIPTSARESEDTVSLKQLSRTYVFAQIRLPFIWNYVHWQTQSAAGWCSSLCAAGRIHISVKNGLKTIPLSVKINAAAIICAGWAAKNRGTLQQALIIHYENRIVAIAPCPVCFGLFLWLIYSRWNSDRQHAGCAASKWTEIRLPRTRWHGNVIFLGRARHDARAVLFFSRGNFDGERCARSNLIALSVNCR